MRLISWILLALVAVIIFVAVNSFYVVRQDQQALVLQLGDPVATRNAPGSDEAGLFFKTPFIQQVTILDRKNLGLNISDIEVLASDQRRLVVDAFVRWRINDPLKFYQRFRTENAAANQLDRFTESAIRAALGDEPVPEIVSGQRSKLMDRIRNAVNENLADTGIDIIDIRIRQADLPEQIAEGVYNRMRTARRQEAERIRAEGEEQARLIRATAEREATVLLAQAREESEKIRGEGDAERNRIYADAYNADSEFFRFYRSLIACEKSIKEGTRIIVDPTNLAVCDVFSEEAARSSGNR
ncbi:MAG: protease modulator HflC [Alphaproteobacteria bacterium]|jgi:membrane protease subunit HflC|nr:protease modulator HflC [Alphaproteobacteria bacterium]